MTGAAKAEPSLLMAQGTPRFPVEVAALGDPVLAWAALIEKHGAQGAAAQVLGDFSVALALGDGRVFLAVDRFAVRSLCWRMDAGRLSAAERADTLAGPTETLSTQAVFDYLYFHAIPSPRTAFGTVHRLPPAHCALLENGQLTIKRYWTPRFEAVRQPAFQTLKAEFRGLLREAVRRQLDGSPPACFLSGGTDSSTVAGMLAQLAPQRPVCYSVGFEAEGYDEMEFARLAARHFGCEHREVYFTPDDLVREIPMVAAAYDQPFGNSSALPSYHCAATARTDGITRLLAGDGGDELFGGNERYATQRLFQHWQRVPLAVRRGVLEPFFKLGTVGRLPLLRKGSSYVRQATTPLPDRAQDYNLIKRIGYHTLFTPAFLGAVDCADVDIQQRAVWAEAHGGTETDSHLAFDWRYTLAESDLPKVVGTAGLAGISVGFPMLDDALVEFSARLPADYKLRSGKLRWFFKEALRGFLPDAVLTKKKQGFGLPFGVWMVRHQALGAMARDAAQSLAARGLIKPGFVHPFFNELLPRHPHYYGTMAWILMMLEHWLRVHAPDWKLES